MLDITSKLRRAQEVRYIVGECAADNRSRLALLGCYGTILTNTADAREVSTRLQLSDRAYPFRMRRSDIFTLGEILHEQQYRLQSQIPDRPTIIDAGANVGVTALWFSWQHPGATIHAFEPEPENYRLLEANFGRDPKVHLTHAGLGATSGTMTLHLGDHGAVHSAFGSGGRTVKVPCLTLGDYIEQQGIEKVDLLKLDVEGSELDVLHGCRDMLDRIAVIVGEVHERVVDQRAFYAFLKEHGFEVLRRIDFLNGEHGGVHGFEAVKRVT